MHVATDSATGKNYVAFYGLTLPTEKLLDLNKLNEILLYLS